MWQTRSSTLPAKRLVTMSILNPPSTGSMSSPLGNSTVKRPVMFGTRIVRLRRTRTVGDRTRGLQVAAAKKRNYGSNRQNISNSDYEKLGKMLGESKVEIEEKLEERSKARESQKAMGMLDEEGEINILGDHDPSARPTYADLEALLNGEGRGGARGPITAPTRSLQVDR
eukprot:CAMPEP_0118938554 /NCGR_PEP_ID=MMETSP1169-20130426/26342_1 /TAXON_ID=36882 /ORGANISM="Pyramimonas obovata, Strain CCMP722" /LENGTH=169 /DNA_ID=CAMNT_0006882529 /DNA_START=111 /DNA_END=617 /DNA_ORIENTATION=+